MHLPAPAIQSWPRRALVGAIVLTVAGCGSSSSDDTSGADAPSEESSAYCDSIHAVVDMPETTVRSDRRAYRAATALVVEASPTSHRAAWEAFLAFIDDDSTEMLNPAADRLDDIRDEVLDACQVNLVLDDWDLLRDQPLTDAPGVAEG